MQFRIKILVPVAILVTTLQPMSLGAQHVIQVSKVTMTVSDLTASEIFYTQLLGFSSIKGYDVEPAVASALFGIPELHSAVHIRQLGLGNETLELMHFDGADAGRLIPADSRSNDLWFQHVAIVVSDMSAAYQRLRDADVIHVSTAPQTLPDYIPAAAGISAFYFRDPDGHNLELIHYPKGKGNNKWQEYAPDDLFLGIDHTAIGVENTSRDLQFYTLALDLAVGGRSENFGPEQEHLNQVFGARLQITGLYARAGFGIEFLDYIAPPGGRAYPEDSTPADLWHWHTTLEVDNISVTLDKLRSLGYTQVSLNPVEHGGQLEVIVRDPDGHAICLSQTLTAP